jgi:hypothetical protein
VAPVYQRDKRRAFFWRFFCCNDILHLTINGDKEVPCVCVADAAAKIVPGRTAEDNQNYHNGATAYWRAKDAISRATVI